jgi:Ca2+-binding EF-hand superfamily protein
MRAKLLVVAGSVILVLSVGMAEVIGQQPSAKDKGASRKDAQGPPDEEREILKEIKEAYKAPFEVHQDVLKELRRSYQQPSPDREAKIFKELRRLYQLTDVQEGAILRELRRAYQQPSVDQEERIFREIDKADRLPTGAVPASVQADQARKMFRKLDLNGDGLLSSDEMPDSLRSERARWDANRDGFIDVDEYWAYYQGRLRSLSEQVASGQIELSLGRGGPAGTRVPTVEVKPRPTVYRAGKLPPGLPGWFSQLDTDGDGQIGLYEWKKSGRPLEEFFSMDRNGDGFLTVDEVMRYQAEQPRNQSNGMARAGSTTVKPGEKR